MTVEPEPRPNATDMPIGTIVAVTGRVWFKTGDDTWESNGAVNITRDGWIEGLFNDGVATMLRLGRGTP